MSRRHAGYYKFSHKHIKPTHTGNLLIDAHNMTHLSGFPNFSKFRYNAIMLPWTNASHGNDFRRLVYHGLMFTWQPRPQALLVLQYGGGIWENETNVGRGWFTWFCWRKTVNLTHLFTSCWYAAITRVAYYLFMYFSIYWQTSAHQQPNRSVMF